ncbi:glycolate oxidase iron-sulfur subunit [Luteibacter rhizovicinus]|uniref:Glycolate oxidase iron-sulfur subunit n=2 Tax=Luteibacter rhizovicinus TaxID=242606 RepID=A0A4R3YHH9_9GAMM|nr:glycolate oxidase iron-sulfur subunit [Luteibacter rhizovicinus]
MCGLCLPQCPTYLLDAQEAESPRGRIAMAAALAKGTVSATPALRLHLDHCLGCMSCEKVCPAKVEYGELLVETRALLGPSQERPDTLIGVLKRPALYRGLRAVALIGTVRRGLARMGGWLPARSPWRVALGMLPRRNVVRGGSEPFASQGSRPSALLQEQAPARGHVALFPGCVASVEDAAAQVAAQRLLVAAGFTVSALPAFCCGAMDAHGGIAAGAETSAEAVRRAYVASGATTLVTATPGCLSTLRRALPGGVAQDVISLLARHADDLTFRPLTERVALHIPCTQTNIARSDADLRRLLARISGLDVATLPAQPTCCGAAGTHMLEFPERAATLRDMKLRQVTALATSRLLSSNVGCRLHLAAGMTPETAIPDLHPLILLAEQLESP